MNILFMSNLNRIITLLVLFFALFVLVKSEPVMAQPVEKIDVVTPGQQGTTTNDVRIKKKRYDKSKIKIKPRYKNMKVERYGTYAKIRFNTNFNTSPFVMVSENEPNGNTLSSKASNPQVPAFNPDDIVDSSLTPRGKNHSVRLDNLKPNTTYHYSIVSYDSEGTNWYKRHYGKFRTLERIVLIDLTEINMIDDSDDLSDGEFVFDFIINKKLITDFGKSIEIDPFGSGDTKYIAITSKFTQNDSDSVEIRVSGWDDDAMEPIEGLPPALSEMLTTTEGCSGAGEYTVAVKKYTIPNDKELFYKKLNLHAKSKKGDSEVEFRVKGFLRVFYQ
ncbi:MAG: fibronectin type III domain-containing protein [Thermodesulfobacteriota bacterium]